MAKFKKGESGNPAGRAKGSKNKFTNLKESFLKAYEAKDGFGGDKKLKEFAKKHPETFLNMITKLFPKDIKVGGDEEAKELLMTWFPPKPKTVEEWQEQMEKAKATK